MRLGELFGKTVVVTLVAAALIGGGILVLLGPHAYNDYFNAILGWVLILMGAGVAGGGMLVLGGIIAQRRREQRERALHITPRPGPPGPPPPWGMGDIGRPGSGVVRVGDGAPAGGGGPRLMSVHVGNFDVPLVVGGLLVWTLVFLILMSPR